MSAIQRKFDEARERQVKAHSATPWKHWQVTIPFLGWEIIGAKNQGIARLPGTRTEDEANARHICLCVNTHERLVEALKFIAIIIETAESDLVSLGAETDLSEKEQANRERFYKFEITKAKGKLEDAIHKAHTILAEIEKGGVE